MTKNPISQRNKIAVTINRIIDLNQEDTHQQTPILGALRQVSEEYAAILLETVEVEYKRHSLKLKPKRMYTKKLPDLNVCSIRHGYPIHIAILSHKFEIALRMLRIAKRGPSVPPCAVDATVTSSIGANIVHLVFVKYEKNPVLGFKILLQCANLGNVNLNHIDTLKAAPIHVAIRKRQY